MPDVLPLRLEKLLFSVREIALAGHLARQIKDDDLARTFGRRVLVRVGDLIIQTQSLKALVVAAGADYQDLKQRREALTEVYEEYSKRTRDKLAAHVQDLDLQQRLDLWFGIDDSTLDYFVSGALEIYCNCLGGMLLPGYQIYTPFQELVDDRLTELLGVVERRDAGRVVMSSDALALTRSNTVAALNFTPVHERAGQLAAIARWVHITKELLGCTRGHPNLQRMLRAQLVTDVVSFADCLITRGGGQQQAGLDQLVPPNGRTVIDKFVEVFRYDDVLAPMRLVRNHIGAHLEQQDHMTLGDIHAEADSLQEGEILETFGRLASAFRSVCREVDFLHHHLQTDVVIAGAIAVSERAGYRPFDPGQPRPATSPRPVATNFFSLADVNAAIDTWVEAGDASHEARDAIWNACSLGPVVETVSQQNGRDLEYRIVHQGLEQALQSDDDHRFLRVVELIHSLSGGYPDPLMVVLQRALDVTRNNAEHRLVPLVDALGELSVSEPEALCDWLGRYRDAQSVVVQVSAIVAVLGLRCLGAAKAARNGTVSTPSIVTALLLEIDTLHPTRRVLAGLAAGGRFVGGNLWLWSQDTLVREHDALIHWLTDCIRSHFPIASDDTFKALVAHGDYCSLGTFLAEHEGLDDTTREMFYRFVADGRVRASRNVAIRQQALVNRARACVRLDREADALRLINVVWADVAAQPGLLIACLEIAAAVDVDVVARIQQLQRHFSLTGEQSDRLVALECHVREYTKGL